MRLALSLRMVTRVDVGQPGASANRARRKRGKIRVASAGATTLGEGAKVPTFSRGPQALDEE
jgi:hypothetical protein